MLRCVVSTLLGTAVLMTGCAPTPNAALGDGAPPWASLTSPTAALEVVLDQVCLPAILEGRPIGQLAEARYLAPVSPASTGSSQATAAWRLGSWHNVHVMQLPNGGCSASLEAGEPDALNKAAVTMIQARAAFSRGVVQSARDGAAENVAWCTAETRPVVVGLLRRTAGRGDALVINVFRAQGERPPFCAPSPDR